MAIEGIPNLRPMKMGQILDQAVRLYRANFISFVGIVALVWVPIAVIQVLVNLGSVSERGIPVVSFGATLLTTILSFIFIQGIGTAGMTRAVADNYLGEKTGAIEAYRKIGRGWLSLVAALFILGLIALVAGLWWLVPCIGWITGLGILVYLGLVITPLVAPIIVLEKQSASEGWRRAWQLARQRFWWVFGFFAVLYLFNLLVVIGPSALVSLLLTFLWDSPSLDFRTAYTIQTIVQQVVTMAFSLLFLPFQLAATTLVYFDLRVRSEGFDLAVRAKSVSDDEVEAAEIVTEAPQADQGSLMTSRELAYFAGLSLIPVALYAILIGVIAVLFAVGGGI